MNLRDTSEFVSKSETHEYRKTRDGEIVKIPLMWKESTKTCWHCGYDKLILLRTLFRKTCVRCGSDMPWELDGNQGSLK